MIVAIDIETRDSRGASFEYFRRDFEIFSLSCAWREKDGEVKQWFSANSKNIKSKLKELAISGIPLVAHNISFELGVISALYPELKLNWYADTMRMAQLRDGGGAEFEVPTFTIDQMIALEMGEVTEKELSKQFFKKFGLSLEACGMRFLEETNHSHKSSAHDWLTKHYGIKSKHGQYLHLLPYDLLKEYNNADTLVTLLLYENCLEFFSAVDFDWKRDNRLYMLRAGLMSKAYREGIKIDRAKLLEYILELEEEIDNMEQQFLDEFEPYLASVRTIRYAKFMEKNPLKTEKGRLKRFRRFMEGDFDDVWKILNIGSSHQLAILFQDVLGMTAKFLTPKGSPSFKTTHLHQWGRGGEILKLRRKRLLVLQQAINTYLGSEHDGRIHCSIKVSGTRTNRVAGGRV